MKYFEWVILSLILTGCAENGREGLISDWNHRYEYEIKGDNHNLYKSLSLTGLLPTHFLGSTYSFNPQEGIDASIELGEKETTYISQTIGENITIEDVRTVSQKIIQLKQASYEAIHEKLNLLKAQRDQNVELIKTCLAEYRSARRTLDEVYLSAVRALKPGILVLQMNNTENNDDGLGFGIPSTFQYKFNNKVKGLLVLGGLKVSTICMGQDFRKYLNLLVKRFANVKQEVVIPTYLLQTKHLIFIDQFTDSTGLSIDVALKEALNSSLISDLDKAELHFLYKRADAVFELGEFSGLKTSHILANKSFSEGNDWITVYAVLPSIDNLYSKIKR